MSIIPLSGFSCKINGFSTWAPANSSSRALHHSPRLALWPAWGVPAAHGRHGPVPPLALLSPCLKSGGIVARVPLPNCVPHVHVCRQEQKPAKHRCNRKKVILSGRLLLIRTYFWLRNSPTLLVTRKPERCQACGSEHTMLRRAEQARAPLPPPASPPPPSLCHVLTPFAWDWRCLRALKIGSQGELFAGPGHADGKTRSINTRCDTFRIHWKWCPFRMTPTFYRGQLQQKSTKCVFARYVLLVVNFTLFVRFSVFGISPSLPSTSLLQSAEI